VVEEYGAPEVCPEGDIAPNLDNQTWNRIVGAQYSVYLRTSMLHPAPTPLVVAVRVYPDLKDSEQEFKQRGRKWNRPDAMFVFDTETRTDETQCLTFGSYQFVVAGRTLTENLFYGDNLPAKDRQILQAYVDTVDNSLSLLTRSQFAEKLFKNAYKGRCLLVAFNFPFDAARAACNFANARRRFAGGFSLDLWSFREARNRFRPSICIKQIDSKRALKGFTSRTTPDEEDLIPEGSTTGKPERDFIFRGHFLDLRTLAFALTDRGYTLGQACEDFGVEHGKQTVKRHGVVTKKYVDYNRRDVLATSELADKLLEEYDKHPIDLQATKAYSPAAIGKAYLRAMGIQPILARQPRFPKKFLGYAQSAFLGGRTSAHIRKVTVPVVYTDFRSMYPTVNSLMNLWSFVIADKITVSKNCKREITGFLSRVLANPDYLFTRGAWKRLPAFVRVIPNGDVLPSRGRNNPESNDWQVATNYLYASHDDSRDALWFSLPDVVASVLLTKQIPAIVDAFRIKARGKLKGLKPTKLRGIVDVDPQKQDFFRVVIEERQRLARRTDIENIERKRLDKALKVLANAASYGIYAEMHRLETDHKRKTTCYGIDPTPFHPTVLHPDEPGAYCFSPMSSLITGAARLMLTLLECSVTVLGGTYAMEDTDSMAIIATEHGGRVSCPGGDHGFVHALSWQQVKQISEKFDALNPYDRSAVPDSILKIEDDNRDPITQQQRQIYCFAISAKRYALFLKNARGTPVLLREGKNNKDDRWSEHGLGHLLNPTDPDNEDRKWIAQAWENMIRKHLGLSTIKLGFEDAPAVGRVTVSSPEVMRAFTRLNKHKAYVDQIKPFNFLLACHVKPLGHPPGVDATQFHLITPYETDSRKWLKKLWIDQYSGKEYRITTIGHHGMRNTARVKTYGDALLEYEIHPESKYADANGKICSKQTVGLLYRRHVSVDEIKYIGKESNSLEDVESGLIHDHRNVYTEYPDERRDEWITNVLPALRDARLVDLVRQFKGRISRRALIELRAGRSRPHRKNQELLASTVNRLADQG